MAALGQLTFTRHTAASIHTYKVLLENIVRKVLNCVLATIKTMVKPAGSRAMTNNGVPTLRFYGQHGAKPRRE